MPEEYTLSAKSKFFNDRDVRFGKMAACAQETVLLAGCAEVSSLLSRLVFFPFQPRHVFVTLGVVRARTRPLVLHPLA